MSWKGEVQVGKDKHWYTNAMRFATEEEARDHVMDLAARWALVVDYRVVECTDPVNYAIVDGALRRL